MPRPDSDREFHARITSELASGKRVPVHVQLAAARAIERANARVTSEQVHAAVDAGASPMDAWER